VKEERRQAGSEAADEVRGQARSHKARSHQDGSYNPQQIAQYYDSNTARFLSLGGSGDVAAIHRAIWAPGVTTQAQAFGFLNQLVANALRPALPPDADRAKVLDLGCGVGGTATWVAQALDVHVTGVTLSPAQVQLAQQRAEALGLASRVNFALGSFSAMPELPASHGAYAIESFVHADDAAGFFAMAARQLLPGARLVLCDDFLNPPHTAEANACVARFRRGWHLNTLLSEEDTCALAQSAGFRLVEVQDLSAHLRGFHPLLLWAVSTLTRVPLPWAYWHNLAGGTALQRCVKKGWTRYLALTWERV
jgi:ubiquinone/menaquinone biosynthesis C-methylase UbiE